MKNLLKIILFCLLFKMLLFNASAYIVDNSNRTYHSDNIIYKGDTMNLVENTLYKSCFINTYNQLEKLIKKKYYKNEEFYGSQTCWEIIGNQLFLIRINLFYDNCKDTVVNLKELFGKNCINGKVKADWVCQNFTSPGKFLYYIDEDITPCFETELLFQFKNGKLIRTILYDNSKSRKSIYYQDGYALLKYIYSNIKWSTLPEIGNQKIIIFIEISANEYGIIDSVIVKKGHKKAFNQEAVRVAKTITGWGVYFKRGQFQRMKCTIPIVFNKENKEEYFNEKK